MSVAKSLHYSKPVLIKKKLVLGQDMPRSKSLELIDVPDELDSDLYAVFEAFRVNIVRRVLARVPVEAFGSIQAENGRSWDTQPGEGANIVQGAIVAQA